MSEPRSLRERVAAKLLSYYVSSAPPDFAAQAEELLALLRAELREISEGMKAAYWAAGCEPEDEWPAMLDAWWKEGE